MSGVGIGPEPAGWVAHVPLRFVRISPLLDFSVEEVMGLTGAEAAFFMVLLLISKGTVKSTGSVAEGMVISWGVGMADVTPARAAMSKADSILRRVER